MNEENRKILINELCHIYHTRNLLGRLRDRARYKLSYLRDVKRFMVYANPSLDPNIARLKRKINSRHDLYSHPNVHTRDDLKNMQDELVTKLEKYRLMHECNPVSKRWKDVSLSKMNMLIVEAECKVANTKLKIMKHTHRYEKRSKFLRDTLNASPRYQCGIVRCITIDVDAITDNGLVLQETDIKKYHDEYLADKAIDKMLSK